MDGFTTFPVPDPPPSPRMAAARVDGQDDVLFDVTGGVFQHLTDTVASNETALRSVYKPLVADAAARVDGQQAVLDGFAGRLAASLGGRVASQTAMLATLPPAPAAATPAATESGWPCGVQAPFPADAATLKMAARAGYVPPACTPDPPDADGMSWVADPLTGTLFRWPACAVPCPESPPPPPAAPPTPPPPPTPTPPAPPTPPPCPGFSVPSVNAFSAAEWDTYWRWWVDNVFFGLGGTRFDPATGCEMVGGTLPNGTWQDVAVASCRDAAGNWYDPCPTPVVPPPPVPPPFVPPPVPPPPVGSCPPTLPPGCPALPPVVVMVPPPPACPTVPPYPPPAAPPTAPPAPPAPPPAPPPPPPPASPPPAPAEPLWLGSAWCDPTRYASILAEMTPPPSPVRAIVSPLDAPFQWFSQIGERAWDAIFGGTAVTGPTLTGSIASYRVTESLAGWAGRVAGADVSYHATGAKYSAQYLDPQYIPSRDELIDLYHKGKLVDRSQYDALCRANGHCSFYSLAMLDAQQPRLGIGDLATLSHRGLLTDKDYYLEAAKIGYWDRATADDAWNLGVFRFDALDTVKLWWRGIIDEDQRDRFLGYNGLTSKTTRQRWTDLQTFLPSPTDAVTWAIKDVFDPNDLGRADKIREFNEQIGLRETLAASGVFPTFISDGKGGKLYVDSPLNYWITQYVECSPTQGYEMLARLRPGRTNRFPLVDDAGKTTYPEPVDITLIRRLLREHDFNPLWRDRLAAISSATIGRIDLRRVYMIGGFGKPQFTAGYQYQGELPTKATGPAEIELVERYRDDKYVPEDALLLAWFTSWDVENSRMSKTRTRRVNLICRGIKLGTLDRGEAYDQLLKVVQYKEDAERIVRICTAEMNADLLASATAGVKRQFLAGELSEREGRLELVKIGLIAAHVDRLLENWKHNRVGRRRLETAQQIATWYLEGLFDRQTATQRLQNIGFDGPTAFRILRHAEIGQLAKTAKEQARIAAARQRALEKAARQQQTEAKQRETLGEKVLARFLAARTVKNLTDWLKDGTITEADVYQTFELMGKSRDDAARVIAHALKPASKPKK